MTVDVHQSVTIPLTALGPNGNLSSSAFGPIPLPGISQLPLMPAIGAPSQNCFTLEQPSVDLTFLPQGVRLTPLAPEQRADRAERLLRANVPDVAVSEAERLVDEVRVGPVATRALRVITDAARRLKGETVKVTIPTNKKSMFSGLFRRAA